MINSWLQCLCSTPCREFENSYCVSYGLPAWKKYVCYISVQGQKGMLRSYMWAVRLVVFFSHAVTPTRGLFLPKFSWAQLTLSSSTSAICSHSFFGNMCTPRPQHENHGRVVTNYLKLKAQRLYIQLSKKVWFFSEVMARIFASLQNCNREELIFTQVDIFTKFELV